jgi:hypothetical protein
MGTTGFESDIEQFARITPPRRMRGCRGGAVWLVLAVLAAVLCCASATPALAIEAHAACPADADPYTATPAVRQACGVRLLPQRATASLPYGGTQYNYEEPNGRTVSLTVPPASFDAATASPHELEVYGVPPEPSPSSPEYPKWKAMIQKGIHFAPAPASLAQAPHPMPGASPLGTNGPLTSALEEPAHQGATGSQNLTATSGNWSGYYNYGGHGGYTHATAYIYEPSNHGNSCGKNVASSTWGGIGGTPYNPDLAQAGTDQGTPGLGENAAWFEVLPEAEKASVPPIHATPGAWFEADTQYKGNGEFSFYFYNFKTGATARGIEYGGFEGKVAEFILERKAPYDLTNVGTVPFQGFTNGEPFGNHFNERIVMENRETHKVNAAPGGVSSKYAFADKYENYCLGQKSEGEGQGPEEGPLPSVTTNPATAVTETAATLNGAVNPEGFETAYDFEYGTEPGDFSASTPEQSAGKGSSEAPVSSPITGLQPGTTYYYRIIANSPTGTAAGTEASFKTSGKPPPPPPTVTTESSSGIAAHAATLGATVNPNGADTHYYFEYGTVSGLYESDAPALPGNDAGSGTSPLAEKVEVTGLEQHATYYYRVVASNATGTSYGIEKTFKTPGWQIVTTPKAPGEHTRHDQLVAVSCASGTICAGVGSFLTEEFMQAPLSESWNGSNWAVQAAPAPKGAVGTYPEAVACSSSTACTATGRWLDEKGTYDLFAERLSGSSWSLQSPATPETTSATLAGVSCPASNECYTAGWYVKTSPRELLPIVERWNGTVWKILTTATLPVEDKEGLFSGISCPAVEHCVAVGTYYSATGGIQPLVENLSGTKWTWQTLPGSGLISAELAGVSCTATSACTAVGHNHEHTKEALIARWNGTSWTLQSSPSPTGKPAEIEAGWDLTQVSCATATVCVTTGWYKATSSEARQLLGEAWNGTAWSLMPPVSRAGAATNEITGLSCPTEQRCFATGYTENSGKTETESLAEELEGA